MYKAWEAVASERTKKLRKKLYARLLKYSAVDIDMIDTYIELFESLEIDLIDNTTTITENGDLAISTKLIKYLLEATKNQLDHLSPEEKAELIQKQYEHIKELVKDV